MSFGPNLIQNLCAQLNLVLLGCSSYGTIFGLDGVIQVFVQVFSPGKQLNGDGYLAIYFIVKFTHTTKELYLSHLLSLIVNCCSYHW